MDIWTKEQHMRNKAIKLSTVIVASSLLLAGTAHAMDMGKMMNPSKWMGGNKDNDRDDDYRGGPGYGGGPGGYGGGPGYVAPASGTAADAAEIERMKARIKKLEESIQGAQPTSK